MTEALLVVIAVLLCLVVARLRTLFGAIKLSNDIALTTNEILLRRWESELKRGRP